jgi:hypothetical protein
MPSLPCKEIEACDIETTGETPNHKHQVSNNFQFQKIQNFKENDWAM